MLSGGSNRRRDRVRKTRFKSQRGPLRLFTGGFKWYWAEFRFDRNLTRNEQRQVPDLLENAGIYEGWSMIGQDRVFSDGLMDWGGPILLTDIEFAFRRLPPGWVRAAHYGATCQFPGCCPKERGGRHRISYLSDGSCRPYWVGNSGENVNPPDEVPEAPWFRLDYFATEPEPVRGPGKWDADRRRR